MQLILELRMVFERFFVTVVNFVSLYGSDMDGSFT